MYIACPECGFKRNVDITQIPASATVATCPKCEQKFRFRDPETGELIASVSETESNETIQKTEASDNITENAPNENSEAIQDETSHVQEDKISHNDEIKGDAVRNDEIKGDAVRNDEIKGDEIKDDGEKLAIKSEDQDSFIKNTNTENTDENNTQETKKFQQESDPEPLDVEKIKAPKETEPSPLNTDKSDYVEEDEDGKYVMVTDDVPWEHPERYGIIGSLVQTIFRSMFRASDFFRTIHSPVSVLRPALFYALIGLFQALIERFWSMDILQNLSEVATDPRQQAIIESMMTDFSTPLLVIIIPFAMILQLMIFTSFVYLAVRIANPEKADFELILRVIAYAAAPLVLSVVPYIGSVIGFIWFVSNIIIGIKYALNLPWQRTALALAPILLLWIFIASHQVSTILSNV